jgi:isopenicillin N synthase-like dioxygenase
MPASKPELKVPTIDLANSLESEVVEQISKACADYGFFQILGHGMDTQLIDEYLEQMRLYFDLPLEVKRQWKRNEGNSRGWFNDELTKQKLDWKEALDFGVPGTRDWSVEDDCLENKCLDGWNQLPPPDILPDFRPVVTKYFDECASLADRIAILMAKGLRQDENSVMVRELRERHSSYLRSNFYPICNQLADDGSRPLGISPHRDAGFLTVLLQDPDCHSLQVKRGDTWVTVHPEKYAFTINTGDMAEVWSNGIYKAPLHRVLSNETKVRYSSPFFYNPSYKARVEPLVPYNNSVVIYSAVLWGYFRAVRFAGDLTDLGVEIQVADFLKENPTSHVKKQEIFAKEADFNAPFSVEKYTPLLTHNEETDSTVSTLNSQ